MIKNDISKNLFIIIVVCVNLVFVPGAYAISLCNKRKALCQREKSGGVSKYYRKKDYQQRDREKKLKDQNHICNDKIEKKKIKIKKLKDTIKSLEESLSKQHVAEHNQFNNKIKRLEDDKIRLNKTIEDMRKELAHWRSKARMFDSQNINNPNALKIIKNPHSVVIEKSPHDPEKKNDKIDTSNDL